MRRHRHDDVLTDYVRERLDRLVETSGARPAPDEAGLRTMIRPRPTLGMRADGSEQFGIPPAGPAAGTSVAAPGPEKDDSHAASGSGADSVFGRFSRQHLMVVGVVLAVGVLIAAFALTRARSVPVDPPIPVSAPVPTEQPVGASPEHEPAPTPEPMRIHVVGEVAQPGVHRLAIGARVADAIEAAGGLTQDAKPGDLNLAQPLADGQQVVIGGPHRVSEVRGGQAGAETSVSGASGAAGSGKLNLNTATAAQLDALPGVGPVTAEKIVSWRTQHAKFTRIEELQEVPGIGPKTFAEIAPHVTV